MSAALDLAAAEGAGGVAVDEQGEHGGGRILRVAAASVVDVRSAQVEQADRVEDEVDEVVA